MTRRCRRRAHSATSANDESLLLTLATHLAINPDPDGTVCSLLKTLLQGEEVEEVSLASASTEIDEHVGDDASRSVPEDKIAIENQLTPHSPSSCRLLCDRHCGTAPLVPDGKKGKRKRRGRHSDEEECATTKDKQAKKKKQTTMTCCPFAASRKCFKHEGVHITLMYSNTE